MSKYHDDSTFAAGDGGHSKAFWGAVLLVVVALVVKLLRG